MHIQGARIRNYRSILDSGELSFQGGFNLIVGANNVGKSSLLLCLAARFQAEPHRSIATLPSRDDPLDLTSRVDLTLVTSGDEVRRILLSNHQQGLLPWPSDVKFADNRKEGVLERILSAAEIPLRVSAQATGKGGPSWTVDEYPAMRLHKPRIEEGDQRRMFRFDANPTNRGIVAISTEKNGAPNQDFGTNIGEQIAKKIYRFGAERFGLGTGGHGTSTELSADARNLPEVLNVLQGNPERFSHYSALVREVFPPIQKITCRPSMTQSSSVDVLVWQVDPALERDDLAMPLDKCGTGVGQVLAILYVALISEQPRTIVIDEPGSFLHPGASRALIAILKRFRRHQYIIATHSPEILSELSDAPVTLVRWQESNSVVEQFARATDTVASIALTEVGARLSDVFGFDNVIWVEGQSDALAFRALVDAMGISARGTGILPVRDTGSFRRRKIGEVLDIYRTLSMGGALIPPALMFLFDREGRTEKEITDAVREGGGRLRFLPRRMLENYLLNPVAIARLFTESGQEHALSTSVEAVSNWMAQNGSKYCALNVGVHDDVWLTNVNAAKLLEDLFMDLSGGKLIYRKTIHTPKLALLIHGVDRASATQIVGLVSDLLD